MPTLKANIFTPRLVIDFVTKFFVGLTILFGHLWATKPELFFSVGLVWADPNWTKAFSALYDGKWLVPPGPTCQHWLLLSEVHSRHLDSPPTICLIFFHLKVSVKFYNITNINISSLYIIIIIILSRHQHGYPWSSPATPLYCPSLPVGLQGYILYWHRAVVCRFLLVILLLLVHVKGSTGVIYIYIYIYIFFF